jgi:hypothetical protein
MIDRYTEMKFSYTYNYAGYIRKRIFDNNPEDEILEVIDFDFEKLLKPDKETTLHDFIQLVIEDEIEYLGRKIGPINDWEELLKDYNVPFSKNDIDDEEDDYCDYLENKIKDNVVKKITDETFQLLFSDRMFCLKFNQLISEKVKEYSKEDFPDYFERDGVLKRCTYFPTWVQRAVFLRDRGCCAVCLKDLTGLLKTDFDKAIDHIVPLNLSGNNDITNLQLICQDCNLDKLGHTVKTSEHYPTYF